MAVNKRIHGLLLAMMVCIISAHTNAATLSEMRAINASQKPGMTVICHGTTVISLKGMTVPVIIDEMIKGYVVSNTGDKMVLNVIYEQRDDIHPAPFHTRTYRLTTTLEKVRQKLEIDPGTVKISVPKTRQMEEILRKAIEAEPVSYSDYTTYRITEFPAYDILAGTDNPDAATLHCMPSRTSAL